MCCPALLIFQTRFPDAFSNILIVPASMQKGRRKNDLKFNMRSTSTSVEQKYQMEMYCSGTKDRVGNENTEFLLIDRFNSSS